MLGAAIAIVAAVLLMLIGSGEANDVRRRARRMWRVYRRRIKQ